MATATELASGCATALVTAVLTDDEDGLATVLAKLPSLPAVLADAAVLLRDCAAVTVALLRDRIDVRNAWEDCENWLGAALEAQHGLTDLDVALDWVAAVLCENSQAIPADALEQQRALAVCCALISEMWAGPGLAAWRKFLMDRAVAE